MDELDAAESGHVDYDVRVAEDGATILRLAGELDMATADDLEEAVRPVIASVSTRLVLDLEGLRFADSTAIALWVTWKGMVPEIEIRHAPALVRRVIESMGLGEALHLR